jgi:hypothetical protein
MIITGFVFYSIRSIIFYYDNYYWFGLFHNFDEEQNITSVPLVHEIMSREIIPGDDSSTVRVTCGNNIYGAVLYYLFYLCLLCHFMRDRSLNRAFLEPARVQMPDVRVENNK